MLEEETNPVAACSVSLCLLHPSNRSSLTSLGFQGNWIRSSHAPTWCPPPAFTFDSPAGQVPISMSRGPKDDYILQKAAARGGEVRCTLLSQAERCTASTHPALQQLPRALAQRHWQDSGAGARKLLRAQRRGRVRKQVSPIPVFTDTGTLSSAGCNSFWPPFFFVLVHVWVTFLYI